MLLQDRVAIITGAASERGIGKATARLFAEHQAKIAILDISGAQSAARDIGEEHLGLNCDVTNKADCHNAVAKVLERFGRCDILVNIAGITQPIKTLAISRQDYDAVLDVNLRGTLLMSQSVLPHMQARKSGSIINMSSVSAQRGGGIFGGPHYSAAKAGILGLSKAMAREFAPDQIRVNAICPGLIDTDITMGLMTPEKMDMILATIPMGHVGEPSDVAGCALFLASSLAAYVTGAEIDVNGGSHIH